ncbi:ATP-binding protein [Nonomuraea sp. NPDC050451]|uniref:ATP-binding protein n=1 Tax=Nonomuraea sp. NPDC050451 TaxID=3364364 RepID=UPI003793EBA8
MRQAIVDKPKPRVEGHAPNLFLSFGRTAQAAAVETMGRTSIPPPPRTLDAGRPAEAMTVNSATEVLLGVTELLCLPTSVAPARAFVRKTLGEAHPVLEEIVLLVSELVTNSVRYSTPCGAGQVELKVSQSDTSVHVQVTDPGSAHEPRMRQDPCAENGRGLLLVDAISERWGTYQRGKKRITWFTIRPDRP